MDDDPRFDRADLVRAHVLACNEQDVERIVELTSPEMEWRRVGAVFAHTEPEYTGHDGIRTWMRDIAERLSDPRICEREFRLVGERHVLLLGALTATERETGAGLAEHLGLLFEVRDNLIHRIDAFDSLDAARQAADAVERG